MATSKKYVYFFGAGKADGKAEWKNLLGGKGANLAEMTNLGIPVPPGFTITTEFCTEYNINRCRFSADIKAQTKKAITRVEKIMGLRFGDPKNPLLVSVRSGARQSMPGMMETVLNVGLTTKTIPGLIAKTNNARFVYDAYRRLIMMYSDVVMEKAAGIEPEEGKGIRHLLEHEMEKVKIAKGYENDTDLDAEDLKKLIDIFKKKVKSVLGKSFPDDPEKQLWGGIGAVFKSWNGKRAIAYRRIEGLPDDWGTAVNVQTMVFGNTGDDSATGVAFTRNPATGEKAFFGEWLPNAQGEDVVAGIRTPMPLNEICKTEGNKHLPSLENSMTKVYRQLDQIKKRLERHYKDMQDIEFTIEEKRLWMLQTRTGKRTGPAAIRMAVEMCKEGLINQTVAIMRVKPEQLDELLHPQVDHKEELKNKPIAKGLPAGPGAGCGQIVLTADRAEQWAKEGKTVVLVRNETSPEDVHGMHAADAILTAKGGMTSHAALVARGWGKCCVVGCSAVIIKEKERRIEIDGKILKEGDWLTINGTKGHVFEGKINLLPADPEDNNYYRQLMKWADNERRLRIRTNAERPEDAAIAIKFGAEGIGLCRTEHMFFDPERIMAMREMIVADNEKERRKAVMKLLPFQRKDFIKIMAAMEGLPVTIRLLDPPLHEFVNLNPSQIKELAGKLRISETLLKNRIDQLHEFNPMLGHRGCRLGITYPEISEMQARAIFEAAAHLTKKKKKVFPEIMVPLISTANEFINQKKIIEEIGREVQKKTGTKFPFQIGTMIEIPRACIVADEVAKEAEFFSFGTNDLTQTAFGFSRDDIGYFLPDYLDKNILPEDPFQSLDTEGVGSLVAMGVSNGRSSNPDLKIGICGEHGGDPKSILFFNEVGMNYVSCSPYRVPIARLSAAQASILMKESKAKKKK